MGKKDMSIFVNRRTFCIKNVKALEDYYLIVRMKANAVSQDYEFIFEIADH